MHCFGILMGYFCGRIRKYFCDDKHKLTIALIRQCGPDKYQKIRQSYYSGYGLQELVLKKYNIRLSDDNLRALLEKWDAYRHYPSDSLGTFTLKGMDCVQGIGVETTEDLSIVFLYLMSNITQSVELMADFAESCRAEHPNVVYITGNQKLYPDCRRNFN